MANIKIPYGLRGGKLIHISKVASGLACGCVCPNPKCHHPLVARKGKITHHFAHHNAPPCEHSLESVVHHLAKEVFARKKKIQLPAFGDYVDGQWALLAPNRSVNINKVSLEQVINDFKPDVVLESDGHQLFVEVAVTHFVDDEKLEKVRRHGVSMIEMDLSDLKNEPVSYEVVEKALADKQVFAKWIYHARRENLIELWRKKQAHNEKLQAEEQKRYESFLQTQKKAVSAFDGEEESYWRVEPCPREENTFATVSYAFIHQCLECDYFRGFRDNKESIVCLGDYYKKRGKVL